MWIALIWAFHFFLRDKNWLSLRVCTSECLLLYFLSGALWSNWKYQQTLFTAKSLIWLFLYRLVLVVAYNMNHWVVMMIWLCMGITGRKVIFPYCMKSRYTFPTLCRKFGSIICRVDADVCSDTQGNSTFRLGGRRVTHHISHTINIHEESISPHSLIPYHHGYYLYSPSYPQE